MSVPITSQVIRGQAQILLKKLEQIDSKHMREAVVADHLDILMVMADRHGYEQIPLTFTGINEKLYAEGVLKW